ncbi:MAG: hypothetical protein RIR49_1258 [Actinomycetota bacterium]
MRASVVLRTLLLPALALGACSPGVDDIAVPSSDAPVTSATAASPTVTVPDVPDAADVFGLPRRVAIDVVIDDGSPAVSYAVAPGLIDPSDIGLDSAFASCWAVEGPDWLPVEVLVVADDGSSVRVVESAVVPRGRTVPADLPDADDGVEVSVTLDRGDGRPVLADGRLLAESDPRRGRVEAITEDGRSLVADYRCEGDVATPSGSAVVEVSLRIVPEGAGAEAVRTLSLRAAAVMVCRSGGEPDGIVLDVEDAQWTSGGFTGITIAADGALSVRVLGGEIVATGARLGGSPGTGVLSAVTDGGARLDGAWSCQAGPVGRG